MEKANPVKCCPLCGKEFAENERTYSWLKSEVTTSSGKVLNLAFTVTIPGEGSKEPVKATLCEDCLYYLFQRWGREAGSYLEDQREIRNLLQEVSSKSERLSELLAKYNRGDADTGVQSIK